MMEREYRRHLSQVRDLLTEAGMARKYSDPVPRLKEISDKLFDTNSFLWQETEFLMSKDEYRDTSALRWLWALVEGLVSGVNTRVLCLAEAGEMVAAIELSCQEASRFHGVFREFSAVRWLSDSKGLAVSATAYQSQLDKIKPVENVLREIQDQLDTRPLLLEHLHNQGISLFDFRQQLESETKEPVLCLPV